MLADFVVSHRQQIITRCRRKVAERSSPSPSNADIDHGVPMFLDALLVDLGRGVNVVPNIPVTAAQHGHDLLGLGFSPSQVVHDYGDVGETIAEMAAEAQTRISADEFYTLTKCLDVAIAAAITQYECDRDASTAAEALRESHRIRVLGDGLRAAVRAARAAFETIQAGASDTDGSGAMSLARSLQVTEALNERIQLEIADFAKGAANSVLS
jgi:hypothetical protein